MMGGITRVFSPPKADTGAQQLMQQQIEEQRQATAAMAEANARREAQVKAQEEAAMAARRARAAGLAGRSLLLNDEVGVTDMQTKLGA